MSSGDPALPCKTMYVVLPPDADESKVRVSMREASVSESAEAYDISPVPPAVCADGVQDWGYGKNIKNGRNQLTYGIDRFYPSNSVRVVEVGRLRTWKVAIIEYWPCRYNPITGRLRVVKSGRIAVDYSTNHNQAAPRADPAAAEMADFVSNPEQARMFYPTQWNARFTSQNAVLPADYAIITTSAIASASAKLPAFVAYRRSKGLRVKVVTETEWGGGTGDAASNNIRNWLKNNYLALGLRYVLLIGDPNPLDGSVPMKLLWPRRNQPNYREAPSDYYYADLTGNWDLDSDGYCGEQPDDFGPGGVDRIPELYVGRIPVYAGGAAALDRILQKTMDYESGVLGNWSRNFMLPMKPLDPETLSYQLGETISSGIARPLAMNPRRVYDSAYNLNPPPERGPCDYSTVLSEWQTNGAGVVVWMTHGSPTVASSVITSDMCAGMNDARPAMVFSASCDNGWPENSGNLAYSLLKQGAVCVESASRASFYYPGEDAVAGDSIGGMANEFARCLIENEWPCGRAAYESRLNLPLTIWANHLVFNIYGDPALCFNSTAFGAISGRVLDRSGAPIASATVCTPDGKKQACAATDGEYRITGLGATELNLVVSAPGYHRQRFHDLTVTPGVITPLDFCLEPAVCGSITGRVFDEAGRPLANCLLTLEGSNASATSLADGSFSFGNVEPGIYSVYAHKCPYADQQVPECLVAEGQTSALNVTLRLCSGNVPTGPVPPPQLPRVSVQDRCVTPAGTIEASWSVPVADDTLSYDYAVSRSPDCMGIITGGEWQSAGAAKSRVIPGLSLHNGDQLYVLVRAVDSSGATSETGVSESIRVVDDPADIPTAKRSPDGTWVRLTGTRIARMGDSGQCFVVSKDGLPGIQVVGVPWQIPIMKPGTTATVVGRLMTQGNMRVLADAEVMPSNSGPAPRPVGLANRAVGGADFFYSPGPPVSGQKGSLWGGGANNIGMLVVVWGRVKSATSHGFMIEDGSLPSGLPITCLGSATPPTGKPHVRVTGIAGPYGVFACDSSDIVPL